MKLIALRDFRKVRALDIAIEGNPEGAHKDQIHKGATFNIGSGENLAELNGSDQELVAKLAYARCVGPANDAALVKRINTEVKQERQAVEDAKAQAAMNSAATMKQVIEYLQGQAVQAKAAK